MRTDLVIAAMALTAGLGAGPSPRTEAEVKKLTPVIFVETVEPCVAFWEERLGFERTIEVPDGDRLGFAAVEKDGVEIMYQSRASIAADVPALAAGEFARTGSALFIEVARLDDLLPRLEGVEVVVPERRTFYGSREVFVRATCGTIVGFAELSGEG